MQRSKAVFRSAALLVSCLGLLAQTPARLAGPTRRALIISNTAYQKLPPLPVDESGPKALAEALRDAQFEVAVHHDLVLEGLAQLLDKFQAGVQPEEICVLFYAGYMIQDVGGNYLTSVDFDPDSKDDIYTIAYRASSLQQGLAKNSPSLSMLILDASWDTPKLAGRTGLAAPQLPAHSWMFASAGPNETTTLTTADRKGLFTNALIKALPQPGLDLTALVTAVTHEVQTASDGKQHPQAWQTGAPRFYYHPVVPIGIAKQNKVDRLMYVYIPAGKFWMGCAPASEDQCKPDEKPRHRVEITRGFWLGQSEVTNDAYKRFDPKFKPKIRVTDAGKQGNFPLVEVSWEHAQSYCQWAGGRLPTEAEWERAARDGKEDEVYPFPDLATSRDKANFMGRAGNDRFDDLAPVQQFDPTPQYQLYDMAGNVWEWVSDWYGSTYYHLFANESPARDPRGPDQPEKGRKHVARGGSWASDPGKHLRISYRFAAERSNNVGFRCLLPDTPEVKKQLNYSSE